MVNNIVNLKNQIQKKAPLIHCLTNHITINDCANIILAIGGKPIMAEHREEVSEITNSSSSLVINLGNITDERMESILISGKAAKQNNIPIILDPVGVGCSSFRLSFAKKNITQRMSRRYSRKHVRNNGSL